MLLDVGMFGIELFKVLVLFGIVCLGSTLSIEKSETDHIQIKIIYSENEFGI